MKKLDIDEAKVRELADLHCTDVEIARIVGCSVDTLTRNFADIVQKGRAEKAAALRAAQWRVALSGNPTMLIWLGKQILAQSDKSESLVTTQDLDTLSDAELLARLQTACAITPCSVTSVAVIGSRTQGHDVASPPAPART